MRLTAQPTMPGRFSMSHLKQHRRPTLRGYAHSATAAAGQLRFWPAYGTGALSALLIGPVQPIGSTQWEQTVGANRNCGPKVFASERARSKQADKTLSDSCRRCST